MEGIRHHVTSADGTRIGLLTGGSGPGLLLVHGGMGSIGSWRGVWDTLTAGHQVTAMDRRGRGSSPDTGGYTLDLEYADVRAVAEALAARHDGPVDVAGQSIGGTCVLGSAARGAPFRRIVLYEPPGPVTVRDDWPARLAAMITAGQTGRAVFRFLTEIIGLTPEEVEGLRDAPGGRDVLAIAAATLPREARALAAADLTGDARKVRQPVGLLPGTASPPWAGEITGELAAALPAARVIPLPGTGHAGLEQAPAKVAAAIRQFLNG